MSPSCRQDPEQADDKDPLDFTLSSIKRGLLQLFLRMFGWDKPRSSSKEAETNLAVLSIGSNDMLNRLRDLQRNLSDLLELCREVERLCTVEAMAASKVSEAEWAEVTKNSAGALESSGQVVADVLKIDNIATSLRPKKSFTSKLTKARIFLQEVLENVPSIADELQKALTAVAEESVKYLDDRLTEIGKQIRQSQSKLNSLRLQQSKTAEFLTNINEEVKQLESAWAETFEALPCALRSRISPEVPPIGSKGSKMLNRGHASYMQDTEETVNHHKLWGPVQERWIHRLERPTEPDKRRLTPLYLKHCNVVGATCSWCGNWRDFLSRDECKQFHVVVIDEVNKATPPELLMPSLMGKKLILSGDYRQLPATFREGRCLERSYNELDEIGVDLEQIARFNDMVTASLFKQLYHDSPDVLKQHLIIEYRFPVQILELVNQFNDPPLRCGIDSSDERFNHGLNIKTGSGEFLTPENHVLWIDTSRDSKGHRVCERQAGSSKVNDIEAQSVITLIKLLNEAAKRTGMAPRSLEIGAITFYGAQVRLLSNMLSKLKPADKKFLKLRACTVDDFQGMEQEIVILSMIRSKPGRIGNFTKQYERVHVAMSRAKKLLIVLGSVDTFSKVEVPFLARDGKTFSRKCYANILDIAKKYGGMRSIRDLL